MSDKNTLAEKVKRTLTSIFPIDKNRRGRCINCGACCNLPTPCTLLKYDSLGNSQCAIYKFRPPACRKYPRTEDEHITKDSCGYRFKERF